LGTLLPEQVTQLLVKWGNGDEDSLKALIPLVYQELQRVARHHLRHERADHTLQSAALVHEAYIRLVDQRNANWRNRNQFFGVASQLMRRILVDYARRRTALRRGAGDTKLSLDEDLAAPGQQDIDVLAVDDALSTLSKMDLQQSRIVELRFFSGLSIQETADVLGISPATVKREWSIAKAWLYLQISGGTNNGG
jgi:RNA polymerase sigma factor (TIGR02999 family)